MRRIVMEDTIHGANQGRNGPRTDFVEIRMKVPRELLNDLDIEVKHLRTNKPR